MKPKLYHSLGLDERGTSIDGIDAALIETDGHNRVQALGFIGYPYSNLFREKLRLHLAAMLKARLIGKSPNFERELTRTACRKLL